ncbi:hypothetical protein O6H91_03G004700 [Diphasiastrum complanatum]|uniref:Uncharacterized protein n=1 Tax=Diphasiastrum complanatum TaxID=34168 RepID=A0ACC2E370_DIPCM|nr:hypothetical protein O6H91_03G004700 [Diphasiastrum complanatum]
MEAAESALQEVVDRVWSSWARFFPPSMDAAASRVSTGASPSPSSGGSRSRMSRDFWMPDHSCRMCYECDSQFTIFNRRHHCRICGRVFCGKCTMNTIPAAVDCQSSVAPEERERVRVCNFCYKLGQQENPASDLLRRPISPSLSPSASSQSSLFSSTGSSSSSMLCPIIPNGPVLVSNSARKSSPDADNPRGATTMTQGPREAEPVSPTARERDQPSSPYSFHNRSEDEDDDDQKEDPDDSLRLSRRSNPEDDEDDSGTELDLKDLIHKGQPNIYGSQNLDNPDLHSEAPGVTDMDGNDLDARRLDNQSGMISNENSLSRASLRSYDDIDGLEESVEEGNFDNPMYEVEYTEGEQLVDYENNDQIWVPPPPEDEEDEIGTCLADEEDDDDEGGWGLPRSSGSMSSSELRNKDKAASEEQRRAMRAVVDGHFRALVAQLLRGENVQIEDEDEKEGWLGIVTYLALQAANLVKPDTTTGAGMDPGGYVKVKCLASGTRRESTVVKGVVCKKHVAHKRMASRFKNPRLLLLGGALEYQRKSNQLSSLDTLLQQERDHLNMTVARIEAHHPNVLLVEKTVARFAQDRLLAKEISLVLNVKRPLLERIARCTGAQVVPSPDHLITPKTGHCELFHVEKFFEEHGSAGEGGKKLTKTLMFFEGCPKPLGCTVLLRGSQGDELKKVKRVVQFAVFAAYHLALETSFLADEGATMHDIQSPLSVVLPNKPTKTDRAITTVPGFKLPVAATSLVLSNQMQQEHKAPSVSLPFTQGISDRTGVCSTLSNHESRPLDIEFTMPTTLPSGRPSAHPGGSIPGCAQVEQWVNSIRGDSVGLMKQNAMHQIDSPSIMVGQTLSIKSYMEDKASIVPHGSIITSVEGIVAELSQNEHQSASNEARGSLDIESRSMLEEQQSAKDDFPPTPSDHQSILVSSSSRCLRKGTICEKPHIVRIKYYGNSDKPLGRFLRDTLFDLNYRCRHCDEPAEAHVHCYTHRLGSLTISVRSLKSETPLPGARDGKIWMWHRCLKCVRVNGVPPAIRRVIMSDAAWGLSFGKFLELSFSNHAAASRVAACGHSLHRDCLRFYGFGSMIACFRYAPIDLHTVHLPPPKLVFNDSLQQEWLRKEANEVADKLELVFAEILDTLRVIGETIASSGSFSASGKVQELRKRVAEFEMLLQTQKMEFEEALQKAAPLSLQPGQSNGDILELNRLRQVLAISSAQWDNRLHYLASALKLPKFQTGSASSIFSDQSRLSFKDSVSGGSNSKFESHEAEKNVTETEVHMARLSRSHSQMGSYDLSSRNSSFTSSEVLKQSSLGSDQATTEERPLQHEPEVDMPTSFPSVDSNGLSAEGGSDSSFSFKPGCPLQSEANLMLPSDVKEPKQEFSANVLSSRNITHSNGAEIDENAGALAGEGGALTKLVTETVETDASADALEGEMRRTLSEGDFPVLADLSDTLEAAWIGDGHIIDVHAVDVKPAVQEIMTNEGGKEGETEGVRGDMIDMNHANDSPQLEVTPSESYSALGEQPQDKDGTLENVAHSTAPISLVKPSDEPEDLESWIGAPFSTLSRGYSRGSAGMLSNSPPKGDVRWTPGAPAIISRAGQVATQGGAKVLLPPGIDGLVVAVYDDEPTSIIAYAILSYQYQAHISGVPLREKQKERDKEHSDLGNSVGTISHPLQSQDGAPETGEPLFAERSNSSKEMSSLTTRDLKVENQLLYTDPMHIKVHFTDESQEGKIKYSVTSYYAKQFDALRKKCCSGDLPFVRSLSRCRKWGAEGGKSNVFFAKTLDDRFIIKQVTRTELLSFLQFAPAYFKYLFESLNSGSPTCLAKILGLYQVTVKQSKGGKDIRMDLMVMENLLYDRHITRLYDLKGSLRSRYNSDSTGKNKVLLDQNLLESMPTAPIFVSNKAKRLLERAVWNDTAFLAYVDVVDYSLLVGVDEEREELVVGIIDFMRQYTWDKHLETWVKASGILGGPKNATPTVISPKQYKKRFRKAMSTYFVTVPDHWTPPSVIATSASAHGDLMEDGSSAVLEEAREDVG